MSTTTTHRIEHERWRSFLDDFSRAHDGETVTVEAFLPETGIRIENHDLRFEGVTADLKDGEHEIIVSLASPSGGRVGRAINDPTGLRVERSTLATSTFESLVVETRGGAWTSVRFAADEPEGDSDLF